MAGPCTSGFWQWKVLVLMATTATVTGQVPWLEVFSTVKGTGQTVYDAWSAGPGAPVRHFRCPVVEHWESLNIQRVKVVLEFNSTGNVELIFNGTNTDKFSWFSRSLLLSSPWNDINTETQNFFSIRGAPQFKRSFYINRNWGGCPNDAGWLVVADGGPHEICPWEQVPEDQLPYIRFSKTSGYANFNGDDIATADRMVIYIDTPGNNVLCSCPDGQSLSEDGTRCVCPIADYVSFDGVFYKDFADPKPYDVASQTCAADGGLLAMPKNDAISTFIYNLGGAEVRWIGLTDTVNEGQWVKGPPPMATVTTTPPFSQAMGKIQVTLSGKFVRVELTVLCVVILYDGKETVEVKIPSSYQNMMCGLCGNYNNMGTDDLVMPNGNIASNVNEFGNSWETDSNTWSCSSIFLTLQFNSENKLFVFDSYELPGKQHVLIMCNRLPCNLREPQPRQLRACTENATCIAWGDPHYKTFNGKYYDFQGPCRYTFAKDCGDGGDFNIEVQQVPNPENPFVSSVRQVYVLAYGYEIAIGQGKVVTVTVPSTNNAIPATPPFSQAMGKIQVTLSGIYVRVELSELCVVVLYDGVDRIEVTIPANYRNMMCGLCGNYNTMGTDDLVMPNGNIASNVDEIGNSWETDSNTNVICHARRGKRQTQEACDPIHSDPCNVHKDPNGPFAACHGVVDPQRHFETCVFDECATQALDCPANSRYSSCATACPATCANPNPGNCEACYEGCECNPGYVQSGLDCVPQADCGCSSNGGYYHKLGAVWEDNGEECECHAGNTVVCEEIDGCVPNPCVANAECKDVPAPGTGATCTCATGYEGDGDIDGAGCTGGILSGLTLVDAGIGHLTVSWTVVGSPVLRYRLRYQPADGSGSYQDLFPAPEIGVTSATVQGLFADTEYTLTLTSFGEDDQKNGEIRGTYTTDPVVVNVVCNQDSMSLSIPRAALPAVNVENLHLLDPDCGATEDEDVFKLETHLQECGTRQETSGDDKFIFSNEVIASQVTYDNGAVRGQPVNLPFQCEFLRQRNVSGGAIMYNIPSPRIQIVDANNSFTIEMHMFTSEDFLATYESSDFPIKVSPSDRLHFGLSVASPLDNLELFARDCVSTPTTNPDDSPRVSIIDDGCQVDETLQKADELSNDKALYYSVAAFTFPNALDPSLVYFHCTMIICFKDDPDSRCKQGCIPPARRRRAVSDGTEGRVRRESSRDKQADITQGPFQVQSGEAGIGPAGVPLGTAVGAAVGVAGIMVLLIVAVGLKTRGGLALGRKKRDDDTVGLDNYAYQSWGKMSKADIADTKA
ncbi:PREDICTED: uncharacterized protein LOC109486987 [Branchiostoma belcheri]|uniref:Uncharacterized protein LOC109486987 n=1 Tax=Branchiostoma belcheri TaxID=7741 RepID=A0A6P5AA26_BRABE|nr:PREDICTED: uncharacterized protein LOC109486987 [Branchiostoma belcheri]